MRRVLVYVRASSARDCFAYVVLAFGLAWVVWIPVLLASRTHEQLGDLLILGTFGPSIAGILLSYRGVQVPGSMLSSRIVYFSLTLLLSWAVLVAHASLWDGLQLSLGKKLLLLLPSAIPAWIVSTAFSRDSGVRGTMRSLFTPRPFGRLAVALVLFPMLLLTSAMLTRIHGGAIEPATVVGSGFSHTLLLVVEFGYAFFFGGGVSEEPGWRGFLLPRLLTRFSPLVASLLVWFPWALWHAPLDFVGYAGPTFEAYLRTRVLILIPLCIILTWIYNRCGGTILSAAIFHSAYNAAPDFIPSTKLAVWMVWFVALAVTINSKMWRRVVTREVNSLPASSDAQANS
jgi:membrane protease YdiL (CAAX protease family)